ncbi:RDD family protein [Actinoplanes sp. NEAU-A12]|uniref:RDD family protein n=1 Tax=Actinoplanes sandaracinus TaxID=3045177 RepID=A0ABT6WW32_9ACTN|nr:RDD family protein [Actinoplanes sandaracinus]MDI6103835.1 RDD family protein [Actinoplanes sandaracinus]
MSSVSAGWYKDPADTSTQRYWDGEGWVGKAIPADAVPPDGPPAAEPESPASPPAAHPAHPAHPVTPAAPLAGPPPGWTPQPPPGMQPPPGWQPPPPGMQPPPGWQPPPPQGQQPPPQGWQQPPPGWQQPPPGWQAPQPGWQQPPPGWQPHPGAQPMQGYPYPFAMPEVRPHGMALAGLGRRLTARLIDIVAVLLLNVVVNGYFAWLYMQDFLPIFRAYWAQAQAGNPPPVMQATDRMSTLSVAIVMIGTLLWLLYEAPSIANSGQTLGKRIVGIKVVGVEKTEPIGFARAFTRWARLGIWTLFWWVCGLGLVIQFVAALSPVFDPRLRQAWHDKAAATVVVAVPAGTAPTVEAATSGDSSGGLT